MKDEYPTPTSFLPGGLFWEREETVGLGWEGSEPESEQGLVWYPPGALLGAGRDGPNSVCSTGGGRHVSWERRT